MTKIAFFDDCTLYQIGDKLFLPDKEDAPMGDIKMRNSKQLEIAYLGCPGNIIITFNKRLIKYKGDFWLLVKAKNCRIEIFVVNHEVLQDDDFSCMGTSKITIEQSIESVLKKYIGPNYNYLIKKQYIENE